MQPKRHALVCPPSDTVREGLRIKYLGDVDIAKAREQHEAYCQALESLGFTLLKISPDSRYPDSVFVEDPAVIIEDTLIITRLRRKERRGEEVEIKRVLTPFFRRVMHVEAPGFIEGGDVLAALGRLYIGLSRRTNSHGAEQLARIAWNNFRCRTSIFEIPKNYLHLKGGVTFHGNAGAKRGTLTVSEEIARHFSESGHELVVTPAEERFGGNCISSDGKFFIHAGRPKTKKLLIDCGFRVRELQMSEFEKIDGAMTCLSKLF
jgi:dimethylargininase